MSDAEDYLNYCPHCGVEVYAFRRAINDAVRNKDGLWDYSLPLPAFLRQFGHGFRGIGLRAYLKVKGEPKLTPAEEKEIQALFTP